MVFCHWEHGAVWKLRAREFAMTESMGVQGLRALACLRTESQEVCEEDWEHEVLRVEGMGDVRGPRARKCSGLRARGCSKTESKCSRTQDQGTLMSRGIGVFENWDPGSDRSLRAGAAWGSELSGFERTDSQEATVVYVRGSDLTTTIKALQYYFFSRENEGYCQTCPVTLDNYTYYLSCNVSHLIIQKLILSL